MKSPLGSIEKRQLCVYVHYVCVFVTRAIEKRERKSVLLAAFFNIRINHKPSPDASTWPHFPSFSMFRSVQH